MTQTLRISVASRSVDTFPTFCPFLACQRPLEGGSGHSWSLASGWHVLVGREGLTWDAALLNPVPFKVSSRVSHKAVYRCICYQHGGRRKRAWAKGKCWMTCWRSDPQDCTICSAIWRQETGRLHRVPTTIASTNLLCSQATARNESLTVWNSALTTSGGETHAAYGPEPHLNFQLRSFSDSGPVGFNAGDEMPRHDYSQLGVLFSKK